MIYTYLLNRGGRGVRSPVDGLPSVFPSGSHNGIMPVSHNGIIRISIFRTNTIAEVDECLEL
jgi:hypothetical protein